MTKDQFKSIRKGLELTQHEFAIALGLSKNGGQGHISGIEIGRITISGPAAAAALMLQEIDLLRKQNELLWTRVREDPRSI